MEEKEIKELIENGRKFMRFNDRDDFESDQEKKLPQPTLEKGKVGNGSSIVLPHNFEELNINETFTHIVLERKSHRVFTQDKMTILELSYLLWATQGIKEIRGKSYATLRTVPSGGARHGFETYLIVRNVEGLEPGRYHYVAMNHELEYLGELENIEENISESLCGQSWASKANVVFYWGFVAYRCEWRYGIFAHRVALIDAGHVGQNLYLAATALKLGTCGIAAFHDQFCNEMFMLDGENEFVVYTAPVGTVKKEDIEKEKEFYKFVTEQNL